MASRATTSELDSWSNREGRFGWMARNSVTSTMDAMCQGGFELVRAAFGNGEHSVTEGRGLGKEV
ncbi:hypothetical protein INS49_007705 [Diaporthe citri]|uniref:uncharacterized protein n=1 Tax=Diaporthe citri TaxID=83186 RepID=UPI001C7F3911|nr:uncharacterized protein INS49_007705 [Diaporthe citri]KAG6362613.1 hypothetical protein INS49_007705 [Diaporthe citri]